MAAAGVEGGRRPEQMCPQQVAINSSRAQRSRRVTRRRDGRPRDRFKGRITEPLSGIFCARISARMTLYPLRNCGTVSGGK